MITLADKEDGVVIENNQCIVIRVFTTEPTIIAGNLIWMSILKETME